MLSSVITKLRCKNSNLFFYNLHLVRKILFFFTLLHISAFLLLRKRCSDIVLRQSMRTESTSSATCQKAVRHVATNRSTRVSQSVGTCQPIGRHVAANRSARGSKQRFNRYRSAITVKSQCRYNEIEGRLRLNRNAITVISQLVLIGFNVGAGVGCGGPPLRRIYTILIKKWGKVAQSGGKFVTLNLVIEDTLQ